MDEGGARRKPVTQMTASIGRLFISTTTCYLSTNLPGSEQQFKELLCRVSSLGKAQNNKSLAFPFRLALESVVTMYRCVRADVPNLVSSGTD